MVKYHIRIFGYFHIVALFIAFRLIHLRHRKTLLKSLWEKQMKKLILVGLLLSMMNVSVAIAGQCHFGDFQTCHKEALEGDAKAQFLLGVMYDIGEGVVQDYKEAVKWYRKAANQGDAKAQFNLGTMYFNGEGVVQDYKEAVKWYRKAANQGYANAQFNLGTMYYIGEGVVQDPKEAVKWFRKAANQGDAKAQFSLGLRYFNGKGVVQNYIMAHMWWNLAASQGDKDAQHNRDIIEKRMTSEQVAKAQELARNWKPVKK